MLKQLFIKNYALIDEIRIDFASGLNILTGETGAGKSIIIGALGLLLGERAKSDVIRQGEKMAVVEGLFQAPQIQLQDLIDSDLSSNSEFLLRREVHENGRSRAFINDSPISNTVLSQIGDRLIDLHGQHAHQTLLHQERHIEYLDNFGVGSSLLYQVKMSFLKVQSLTTKLNEFIKNKERLKERQDLLAFQLKEIEQIKPEHGEEEQLEQEERLLRNSERLVETANRLSSILYDGEDSVAEQLSTSENDLSALSAVDIQFEKWAKDCESARILIQEMVSSFQSYVSKIEFNPERLEEIRERLGLFTLLKKKYGGSMEAVLSFWDTLKKELSQLDNIDEEDAKLKVQLEDEIQKFSKLCFELSSIREALSKELEKSTLGVLRELGLPNSEFSIQIDQTKNEKGFVRCEGVTYAASKNGIDNVEFYISTNPGESPKPLAKIASGGEVSRIMLSLKSVLADADQIPVLVFDEIDTGISGRIARVVGSQLKKVSDKHQVICITHLPQIASMGNSHYCVEKTVVDNRSQTHIRLLSENERISEIAKLLGGEETTESTLQSARELLTS